jgi:hypothetical protein
MSGDLAGQVTNNECCCSQCNSSNVCHAATLAAPGGTLGERCKQCSGTLCTAVPWRDTASSYIVITDDTRTLTEYTSCTGSTLVDHPSDGWAYAKVQHRPRQTKHRPGPMRTVPHASSVRTDRRPQFHCSRVPYQRKGTFIWQICSDKRIYPLTMGLSWTYSGLSLQFVYLRVSQSIIQLSRDNSLMPECCQHKVHSVDSSSTVL